MARPPADKLKNRCKANNASGHRCGSPALSGFGVCAAHLGGKAEAKALVSTGARLVTLTVKALNALEAILDDGPPDAQIRAAKLVLDRTAPAAGPHAVYVQVGAPASVAAPVLTAADVVRERMAQLRAATFDQDGQEDGDIIDAELVDGPLRFGA